MEKTSFFKFAMLSLVSRPAHERAIYRTIRESRATSIVEFGIQKGLGSKRMIEAALRFSAADDIRYVGIDLFEARPAQSPGLKLKDAHRTMQQYGVRIQLIPGDPFSALARSANSLTGTDLIVIRQDQDQESLQRAWFYIPRMLHANSVVLCESTTARGRRFESLAHASIEKWAASASTTRRAA